MCILNSQLARVDWLTSGNFARFPKLKICLAEGGVKWMPSILERLDETWAKYPAWCRDASPELPSSYVRDHVYGCFISDTVGSDALDVLGGENIMAETDYPHADSMWPHSHAVLLESLRDVREEQKYSVLRGNAERLFNFVPTGVGHR
jgi:predicted TIM-barrel fold metal-dependent hydrolase